MRSADGGCARVPVTVLTGFLGAGKTTVLNRILSAPHGHRIAVIENEFGDAGIDAALLVKGDAQIVELNNGCICCTVRDDLVRLLGQLARRRDAGELAFDRVIIETTGLACPGPVAQPFFTDAATCSYYRLDAIVTVVDALHAGQQLDAHRAVQQQIGCADRILVSKSDLVSPAQFGALHARLNRMNARAPVRKAHFGHADPAWIVDVGGFSLDAAPALELHLPDSDLHAHDDAIASFVFRAARPFRAGRLEALMASMFRTHANDLLRYKGVLDVAGLPARVVFQGMHTLMGSDLGQPWGPDEPRESVMVFIGRNLPRERFLSELEQCLARRVNTVGCLPDAS